MEEVLIILAALLASVLTLISGFGLGTLLLPVFALFFPLEIAVALTAVVHLLNNLFKTGLLWRCLLYTSDAADERSSVDLGGRRIIKKKKQQADTACMSIRKIQE